MVPDDTVDDGLREAVAFEELAADHGVRSFDLVIDRFADIVQETGALHRLRVVSRFRREHSGDVRYLDRVTEHVLAVGRAEMQTPKELHEVRIEAADADLVDRRFGCLLHHLVDLGASLRDHLLDAGGMDAPVDEQTLERALGDLAADWIEPRDDNRFRGVVDDQIDAGERLQGPDVPAFATDDPTLHVVAREGHDGHAVLGCVLRGVPLEGHGDDVASALVRPFPGLDLELAHLTAGDLAHLLLDPIKEQGARLLHGQGRHPGKLSALLVLKLCDLRPLALKILFLLAKPAVALVHLRGLLVELLVLLVEPALVALELCPALAVLELGGLGDLEGLVLGLEDDLVLPGSRLGEQAVSVRPRGGLARERERAPDEEGDHEANETRDEGRKAHDEDVGHDGDPFRAACAGTLACVTALAPVFA